MMEMWKVKISLFHEHGDGEQEYLVEANTAIEAAKRVADLHPDGNAIGHSRKSEAKP